METVERLDEEFLDIPKGLTTGITTQKYADGQWQEVTLSVPKEMSLNMYINGQEFVTILCTPNKLNFLVMGYLLAEGFIRDIEDLSVLRLCEEDNVVDVRLKRTDIVLPQKRILTSGCGGGISYSESIAGIPKIDSKITLAPEQLLELMKQMLQNAELYRISGGIHTSALCDTESVLAFTEDIGRHNTIDKIIGECAFRKISLKDKILITTGRISSEMLRKAVKMEIAIVASLTSPTERAIALARDLDVTLVGYVRGNHLTVYSKRERLTSESK